MPASVENCLNCTVEHRLTRAWFMWPTLPPAQPVDMCALAYGPPPCTVVCGALTPPIVSCAVHGTSPQQPYTAMQT
eukprot:364009-Chlamydomonas_euryale.AAC.10